MKKIRFLGDNHGMRWFYKRAISGIENSIQVGDFGVGFDKASSGENVDKILSAFPGSHRFIRGNHDNPQECKLSKNYIPDGTIEDGMMFIGGGASIDKEVRLKQDAHYSKVKGYPVVSWWPDEELSYKELSDLIDVYEMERPSIMVTHECPEVISEMIKPDRYVFSSRTRQAFQSMFEIHRPDLWIFGHWHVTADLKYKDTRFICLNIDEYVDIEV